MISDFQELLLLAVPPSVDELLLPKQWNEAYLGDLNTFRANRQHFFMLPHLITKKKEYNEHITKLRKFSKEYFKNKKPLVVFEHRNPWKYSSRGRYNRKYMIVSAKELFPPSCTPLGADEFIYGVQWSHKWGYYDGATCSWLDESFNQLHVIILANIKTRKMYWDLFHDTSADRKVYERRMQELASEECFYSCFDSRNCVEGLLTVSSDSWLTTHGFQNMKFQININSRESFPIPSHLISNLLQGVYVGDRISISPNSFSQLSIKVVEKSSVHRKRMEKWRNNMGDPVVNIIMEYCGSDLGVILPRTGDRVRIVKDEATLRQYYESIPHTITKSYHGKKGKIMVIYSDGACVVKFGKGKEAANITIPTIACCPYRRYKACTC